MLRHQAILTFLIFVSIANLFGQKRTLAEFKQLAIKNPSSVLENITNNDSLSKIEKSYLQSFIKLKEGSFLEVDSIVSFAFSNYDFSQDSLIYMRYLMVLSEHRKISTMDFQSSLKFLYKAAELARKYGDTSSLITAKISLGELFRATQNYNQGFENLNEAEALLGIFKSKESWRQTARLYDRRSALFIQAKIFPDSIEKLSLKTIELAEENGDLDLAANSSNSLGYIYLEKKPPDARAEKFLLKAIQNWDSIGYDIYATNARINLVRFLNRTNRIDDGIKLLLPKLEMVNQSNWGWEKGGFYGALGRLYEKNGEYKKAMHYIQQSNAILTEIETSKFNDKLTSLSVKFNVKEKEEEILRQQLSLERSKKQIIEEKSQKNILTIFLIAAVVIVLLAFYYSYTLNKQKRIVSTQRDELEDQKKIISKKNIRLNELVLQREALLREVNHRVKNNLSILSSLLYLQNESIHNEEAKIALHESQLRIHSISLIHESLYQRDDMESVDFQNYIEDLFKHIKKAFWKSEKTIKLNIDVKDFLPELKESVPAGMIINELLTNSFKYAFTDIDDPTISISFKDNSLVYFDNGPGFIPNKNSTSLGLELITTFAIHLSATVHFKKEGIITKTILQFE